MPQPAADAEAAPANPEHLVDINDPHAALGYIRITSTEARIGATTRHRELLESEELAAAARSSVTPSA